MHDLRESRSLLTAGGLMWLCLFAAGCATTVNAPGDSTTATVPAAVESTAAAPKPPAATPTPDATAQAALTAAEAEEALVSLEERVQALALRASKLSANKEPAGREAELTAVVDDLSHMAAQLAIMNGGFTVWQDVTRQERQQRASAVVDSFLASIDRLGEVPGMAGSPAAEALAKVKLDVETARAVVATSGGTPGSAPSGTATP
jgi:hypothetical protein